MMTHEEYKALPENVKFEMIKEIVSKIKLDINENGFVYVKNLQFQTKENQWFYTIDARNLDILVYDWKKFQYRIHNVGDL